MKRYFQRYRDDRFALTTLQNPDCEVRTYAELVQAAQQEREWQPTAARIPATQTPTTPPAPDPIPTTGIRVNDASAAPDPAPAPLDFAIPDTANLDSTNDEAQRLLDSLVGDVVAAGSSLPSDDDELTPPCPKPRRKAKSRRGTGNLARLYT